MTGQAALYGWSRKRLEFAAMMKSNEKNLAHIINRMANDTAVNAPADAITYAKNLYRTRSTATQPSAFRRILAVLQLDLVPNKAAFGERSVSGVQARQLLFEAGDNAVDLRINTGGEKFLIRGQILGTGFDSGSEAELAGSGHKVRVKLDTNGGFSFAGLGSGEYGLTIQSTDTEIVVEKIIL